MKNITIVKIFVAVLYVGMVVVNILANSLPINGKDTGQISDNYQNLFAPAGITFSIWGLIYLLLALYTLYQFGLFQADKGASRNELFIKIGVPFIVSSLANILWIFLWHYDVIWATVLFMLVILSCLIEIATVLSRQLLTSSEKLFILAPFSIYFGWITVATIANITVFLVSINWDGWGLPESAWAAALIVIGSIIGIWRMFKDKNVIYGSVFVWAYWGIYIKHSSTDGFNGQYPLVMATAIICAAFFVILGGYLLLKKTHKHNCDKKSEMGYKPMRKFLFGFVAINYSIAIYFWWSNSAALFTDPFTGSGWIGVGRIAGLTLQFLFLMQLLLIGRIVWIEQLFGFNHMNRIHRILGMSIGLVMLVHPASLIIGYSKAQSATLLEQLFAFINTWDDVFKAVIAVGILVVVVFFSIVLRHRIKYEIWYIMHLSTYATVFLVFGHQIESGDFSSDKALLYWYTLNFSIFAIFIFYRWIRPVYNYFYRGFYVERVVQEAPEVWSVYVKGRSMDKYTLKPGQYAHVYFLAKGYWFSHPFSYSMPGPNDNLRFTVKSLGDFSSRIKDLKSGTKVMIDGPFGTFTKEAAKTDKFLLIAGGIGITPIRSLAEDLSKSNKDCVLFYSMKDQLQTVFLDELQALGIKLFPIFTNHSGNKISALMISKMLPDFAERDIYICGPKEMIKSLTAEFRKLGVKKHQIHHELFSY